MGVIVAKGFFPVTLSPGMCEGGWGGALFLSFKKVFSCGKRLLKLIRLSCGGTVSAFFFFFGKVAAKQQLHYCTEFLNVAILTSNNRILCGFLGHFTMQGNDGCELTDDP